MYSARLMFITRCPTLVWLGSLLFQFSIWSAPVVPPEKSSSAAPRSVRWVAPAPLSAYRTILWTGDSAAKQPDKTALFFKRLREMGVNTGMIHGEGDPQRFRDHQFDYYVENIVNRGLCLKWNSKVTDWDKFVTAWKDPRDEVSLVREYCLDDPKWREYARDAMQRTARRHFDHNPVMYNIRDELSVTISANPFDYDFHPLALAQFRRWLQSQYPSLEALNQQWETRFATWEDVKPFTTDQIKHRMASGIAFPPGKPDWQAVRQMKFDPLAAQKQLTRWNFSPWCDFRTYMDLYLARTLDDLRQASHDVDARTPVGIEGTQMPHAFGGSDLWRLSQALDWVEPYDVANAREIFGSFMAGKPVLCTVFEKETGPALRRLWHLLLLGDRGCIVWWSEDCLDWKSPDLGLTAKARALAPALKEMTSPLADLFLRAQRQFDPIAIHYSQPSIQVNWLLESIPDGSTWLRRFSSFEAQHNRMAKVRNAWLKALQDLGYTPRFVSSEQIEQGTLTGEDYRALVLPESYALSEKEITQIHSYHQADKTTHPILADGSPGLFDEHGKLRSRTIDKLPLPGGSLSETSAAMCSSRVQIIKGDISQYQKERMKPQPDFAWPLALETNLPHVPREVTVPLESRTRVHRYQLGQARLLAFERNVDYHMSEDLKQAGGNEALEKSVTIQAELAVAGHLYDLVQQKYLGNTKRFSVALDPWHPALFAVLPEQIPLESLMKHLSDQGR